VAKPELGTKRLCAGCGAKYYDLNKDPITCPKCGTVYEVVVVAPRGRPDAAAARAAAAAQAAEPDVPDPQEAEFVSLEEADAETEGGAKKVPAEGVEDVEDVEVEGGDEDDATFIEETEEEDTDVSEIIGGDIEDEEET
jgi:uncharacterized protein (TIGR02300 family)